MRADQQTNSTIDAPCEGCARRDRCRTPCARLEALLPSPAKGGYSGYEVSLDPQSWSVAVSRWSMAARRPEGAGITISREGLTARESDCLELYLQGLSYRHIARDLGVSPSSVVVYLKRVRVKLAAGAKLAGRADGPPAPKRQAA